MDWKAFTTFGAKDEISGAVQQAQKNTEKSSKGMGDSMGKAGKAVDGLREKFSSMGSIAGGVALGNLIASGVKKGLGAIKNLVASVDEFTARADNIRVSSLKIGLSAEGFQQLAYAANTSNVETSKLTAGFTNLNKTLGSGALVKYLNENNKALAANVKTAKSNEAAFMMIADALSKETDVTKRAALGNAAFGKSWAELYPMMTQGADGIRKVADSIPNLISDNQIAAAQLWNNTIGEIKRNLQAFGDTIRTAVIQYVGPYVLALKDWIANNRELIQQKIAEVVEKAVAVFRKAVSIIREAIEKVQKIISFFQEWGRLILVIGGAIAIFWGAVNVIIAVKNAVTMAKSAFAIFNAVVSRNPLVIIIMVIAAAVAGFMLLTKKVGGVLPALTVLRETFFKMVLTPINLIIDLVQAILPIASKVVTAVIEFLRAVGQTIMKIVLTPLNLIIDALQVYIPAATQGIVVVIEFFKALGQTVMKFALTPFNLILDGLQLLLPLGAHVGVVLIESFKAVGQTIMKVLLTPINLIVEGIKGVLNIASKLPGVGNMAKGALEAVDQFQRNMNTMLTGSESTLLSDGLNAFADPTRAAQAGLSDKIAAAEAGAMQGVSGIQSFQDRMNVTLTGSTSTISSDGLGALLDPARNAAAGLPDKMAAAKSAVMPGVEGLQSFQDAMNTALTGSTSTIAADGLAALADPMKTAIEGLPDKMAGAEATGRSRAEGIQGLQDAMNMTLTGSTSTLTSDPAGFLFDSYDRHRAAYVAENPESVGVTSSPETDKWDEMIGLLQTQNKLVEDQTGAIGDLADSGPNSPKKLRYGAMGGEDFWQTARAGL